jgi:protein-tyrosine phosphatase
LRDGVPGGALPAYGVYLLGKRPPEVEWESRWVLWPDFRLPADDGDARDALVGLLARAGDERVEVACAGGRGRTGTALACLAVLDGIEPREAVAYVRTNYHSKAVETFSQKRYVRRFARS